MYYGYEVRKVESLKHFTDMLKAVIRDSVVSRPEVDIVMWYIYSIFTDMLVALIGNSVVSRPQGSRGWVQWGSGPDFSCVILDVSK